MLTSQILAEGEAPLGAKRCAAQPLIVGTSFTSMGLNFHVHAFLCIIFLLSENLLEELALRRLPALVAECLCLCRRSWSSCAVTVSLSPTGIFLVTENIMCLLHKAVLLKSKVFPFLFLGEAKNRKYDPLSFHRFDLYGIPTPHFNDGRNMAKTLRWLHELQM